MKKHTMHAICSNYIVLNLLKSKVLDVSSFFSTLLCKDYASCSDLYRSYLHCGSGRSPDSCGGCAGTDGRTPCPEYGLCGPRRQKKHHKTLDVPAFLLQVVQNLLLHDLLWSALTCGGARGLGRCSTSIGRVCQSDAGTSLWYDWCAATILLLDVVVTFWYILHILQSCARK